MNIKRKIEKIAHLRTEPSQVPSTCVDADMKEAIPTTCSEPQIAPLSA